MSKPPKKRCFGKYRGIVVDNVDLENKGRITAMVADVLGQIPTTWATPCVPITGPQSGVYVVPPIGASVWMEFEHGDPDQPIWSGCFWGSPAEVPVSAMAGAPGVPNIVLQTVGQNTLWMSGDPVTGIVISCGPPVPGAMPSPVPGIVISAAGVSISDGKGGSIVIAAGAVTINLGALVVKQP